MPGKKINRLKSKQVISIILSSILTLIVLMYLPCDIYNFSSTHKFSGSFLYNPYNDSLPCWQKTNFHAHAIAWNGITNGKQGAQSIINLYTQKGYNYASVSNYENIAQEDAAANCVNVYEHGYNFRKVHHLVIMPQKICYADFPFYQFTSCKQSIINKLSASAKLIALPHPLIQKAYSDDDLKKLSGYDLMEVLNHSVNSSCKWDIVLSAGKPVWIIGDDDTHDVTDAKQTFTNWTMIDCHQHNKNLLVDNLENGNAYGVSGKNAMNDNRLLSVLTNNLHVKMQLLNNADSIKLIGQNGVVKKVSFNTDNTSYAFADNDTYIRAVIYSKASTMFLNPVMRYDGKTKPKNNLTAIVNPFDTLLYKSFLIICWMLFIILLNLKSAASVLKWINRLYEFRRRPSLSVVE